MKIIKKDNEFIVITGIDYFIYIANRIIDLKDFNNFFNGNRLLFTIKIIIIIAFLVIMWRWGR